ncbi:hypothetical protein PENTCL1PPCAC_25519, partial [Pristionchus entomophagus]
IVKLNRVIRTRFQANAPHHLELAKLYLQQLILYIFSHTNLRRTEYAAKLEDTFYWGLTNPMLMMDEETRNGFLCTFEMLAPRSLPARLMFIFCQYDWTLMRDAFWIKHALFLLIRCAFPADPSKWNHKLNLRETATFGATMDWLAKEGPMEEGETRQEPMETGEKQNGLSAVLEDLRFLQSEGRSESLQKDVIDHLIGLIWTVLDPSMVRSLFTRLITSIWSNLRPQERYELETVIPSFLSSASHMSQTNQPISSLAVIVEALSQCKPSLQFAPALIKYMSSRHRTFYLGMLLLEEEAEQCEVLEGRMSEVRGPQLDTRLAKQIDTLESLNALYTEMNEADQQIAVWKRRAIMPGTVMAVEAMAKGDFVYARNVLEILQMEQLEKMEKLAGGPNRVKLADGDWHMATATGQYETDAWTNKHLECLMNLCSWNEVEELVNRPNEADVKVLMQAVSHGRDPISPLRQCKKQLADCLPPDFIPKYAQYSALIEVLDMKGGSPEECLAHARRATDEALTLDKNMWRMLPVPVGVSHLKLMQMCHIVQDMADAADVTSVLHPSVAPFNQRLLGEVRSVVKTWKSWNPKAGSGAFPAQVGTYNAYRSPSLHDDLATTADLLNIRKHVFVKLSRTYENWISKKLLHEKSKCEVTLPIQSLIHTQILAARAFRSAKLFEAAEHELNLVYGEYSVPIDSVVCKIVEHIKLLRGWANDETTTEARREELLKRALQVTNGVHMEGVNEDLVARIYAQRGRVLGDIGDLDNAKLSFDIAVELAKSDLSQCYAFTTWAKHLDARCHAERNSGNLEAAALNGVDAVVCYLEGAKIDMDAKSRRHIARAIWLTRIIAEIAPETEAKLLSEKLEAAARACVANHWIEWLPQLCLDVKKGNGVLGGFIGVCARVHPVHTYFVTRQHMPVRSDRMTIVEDAARNPYTNCTVMEDYGKGDLVRKYFVNPQIADLCRLAAERRPSHILAMERIFTAIDEMKDVWAERQLRSVIDMQTALFKSLDEGHRKGEVPSKTVTKAMRRWRERLEKERSEGWCRKEYIREIDIRRSANERLD